MGISNKHSSNRCASHVLLRSWQEAAEADRRRRHQGPSAAERAAAWEAEKAEAKLAKVLWPSCWPCSYSAAAEGSFTMPYDKDHSEFRPMTIQQNNTWFYVLYLCEAC